MIFKEIIIEKGKILSPIFNQLFDLVIKNQIHPGDLLLVNENGYYYPEVSEWNNLDQKYLPYTIGQSEENYSEMEHYKFIDAYRRIYECKMTHEEYLKEIKWDSDKKEQIEEFIHQEELTIHLEMLVYLKIWESDSFIKRFYQLAKLSNGEEYEWHFKIAESNRDTDCTGTRQEIIREKIRNKFEINLPLLYSSFKNSYITQIRNAIAHSKYSFLSRYMHLNNYIKEDKYSQLKSLKFDDWIDIFHETMVLYNEYIRFFNRVNSYYIEIAKKQNNLIQVKLSMQKPESKVEYIYMEFRPDWNDFKLKIE